MIQNCSAVRGSSVVRIEWTVATEERVTLPSLRSVRERKVGCVWVRVYVLELFRDLLYGWGKSQ